jgi:hypothetical protein
MATAMVSLLWVSVGMVYEIRSFYFLIFGGFECPQMNGLIRKRTGCFDSMANKSYEISDSFW